MWWHNHGKRDIHVASGLECCMQDANATVWEESLRSLMSMLSLEFPIGTRAPGLMTILVTRLFGTAKTSLEDNSNAIGKTARLLVKVIELLMC